MIHTITHLNALERFEWPEQLASSPAPIAIQQINNDQMISKFEILTILFLYTGAIA